MAKSPMVETAVKVLEAHGSELTFNQLWEKIIDEMQIDKDTATKRIAKLYSDITLDKRFISLPDNKWDLRRRRKLDDPIVVASDIIEEDEDLYFDDFDEEDKIDNEEESKASIEFFDDEEEKEYDEDIAEFVELAIASED